MKIILSTVLSSLELDKTTANVIENISLAEDSKIKSIKNFDGKRFGQIISDNIKLLKSPMLSAFGVQVGQFRSPDAVAAFKQWIIEGNKTKPTDHQHDIRTKTSVYYLGWVPVSSSGGGKGLNLEIKTRLITDFHKNNGKIDDIGDVLFNHLQTLKGLPAIATGVDIGKDALGHLLIKLSNTMAQQNRRGGGNYLVITKSVYEKMQKHFGNEKLPESGVHYIGDIDNIRVIVNMNSNGSSGYLIYKGSDTDAGVLFVPFAMNHRNCFDPSDEAVTSYYAIHTRDDYKNYITKINFTKL